MGPKGNHKFVEQLRKLVLTHLQPYPIKVYLIGSRATQTASIYSDIDIAIWPQGELPLHLVSDLKDLIEDSTIPYSVDIVDLAQVDEPFRQSVLKYAVLWKD